VNCAAEIPQTPALRQSSGPGGGQGEIVAAIERFRKAAAADRLDAARRSAGTGARSVPAPARLRRVEAHRDAAAPPADHWRRVRHVPLCDQLDAVRPAAGRRALPARRGRPLRQPHLPAPGRGRGARPAEPLLRPLVHHQWAVKVATLNRLDEYQLERFLFSAERVPLERVRGSIIELQKGRCFHCAERLASRAGQTPDVDHFIPWSRYPDDDLENLVVAHARCNAQKRDFLAAAAHVDHWRARTRSGLPVAAALSERQAQRGHRDFHTDPPGLHTLRGSPESRPFSGAARSPGAAQRWTWDVTVRSVPTILRLWSRGQLSVPIRDAPLDRPECAH